MNSGELSGDLIQLKNLLKVTNTLYNAVYIHSETYYRYMMGTSMYVAVDIIQASVL